MRSPLFTVLAIFLAIPVANAQSVMDNLPPVVIQSSGETPRLAAPPPVPTTASSTSPVPASATGADPYTVADVNADVTADSASHARDQALAQAERIAFGQICARLNAPDTTAKMDDDTIASMVQSFELQSEHVSPVRYKAVFTIRFKPSALQKRLGKFLSADPTTQTPPSTEDAKQIPLGPVSHLPVSVQTDSLADWTQIKKRLTATPQVAKTDVIDLGRGASHIDISYTGAVGDLQQTLTSQGLILRQNQSGAWILYDGSMVPR